MESLTEEIITPASLNYHKPAEFQEHECCWMSWPCEDDAIPGSLEAQHRTYADVANAIVNYEPVNMLVDPGTIDMARAHCDPRINLMCGSYINFYFANKSVIIPGWMMTNLIKKPEWCLSGRFRIETSCRCRPFFSMPVAATSTALPSNSRKFKK